MERHEAEALPWPGCPAGLRYRPGTNVLEGEIAGVGPGPFLALEDAVPDMAVSAAGVLRTAAEGHLTVGAGLAALWPGVVAASSPLPPGEEDAILIIATAGAGPRVLGSVPVEGAVRALAGRALDKAMRLVAAVEEPGGRARLVVMDLALPRP